MMSAGQVAAYLESISSELEDMSDVAAEWTTWSENSQCSYALEWERLMWGLHHLAQTYGAGQMSSEQQAQYGELLGKLREALPIIEQLKLLHPPVPLDVAA